MIGIYLGHFCNMEAYYILAIILYFVQSSSLLSWSTSACLRFLPPLRMSLSRAESRISRVAMRCASLTRSSRSKARSSSISYYTQATSISESDNQ